MDTCVRHFREAAHTTIEEALEAATLHPAQLLRITDRKGTLEYGTDADFIMLDDNLNVKYTYVAGELVWDVSKDKVELPPPPPPEVEEEDDDSDEGYGPVY